MWFEFALPPLVTMTFAAIIFLSSVELVRHKMALRKAAEAKVKLLKEKQST